MNGLPSLKRPTLAKAVRLCALPGVTARAAAPASIALSRGWSAFRLVVMDAHQPEGVRAIRTPIVVRTEPHIPVIGRFLFVTPADGVATVSVVSSLKKIRGKSLDNHLLQRKNPRHS